jgi:hypothetical protein
MTHPKRSISALLFAAMTLFVIAADKEGFVDSFNVKHEDFASTGRNDYFILEPGYQHVYEGKEDGKPGKLIVSVLDETRTVDGVETRVVEEREWSDGKLAEVSRNFFAIDKSTNDVYYFGEDVDEYKDGKLSGHGGSWEAGKKGAHYGMFMPAKPEVGQKFYQELAPKEAMDRFEIASTSEKVKVPAGEFENCVKTKETTPLEPDSTEYKLFAPKVGLIVDGGLKLVKHGPHAAAAMDKAKKQQQARKDAPAGGAGGDQPVVPIDFARQALGLVGADPAAEAVWVQAINDPALTPHERQDLIEDLNEVGFNDPKNVSPDEVPLIVNRLALIEQLAPGAMDDVNDAAFAEAYKDLNNMLDRFGN